MKTLTLDGRYRLDEPVGSGGMATVWRGFDLRLRRKVAVKVPASHLAEAAQVLQRTDSEAQAVARLNHANIAAVFDVGCVRRGLRKRVPYLVMEFVDGRTLQSRLRRTDPMQWTTAARICAQVAAALAAAHEGGVVHRDVKPDNIMLAREGVKVVDFGLAALLPLPPAGSTRIRLGTPEYMAPEQLRGDPVTAAGDVYAFGMVSYRLLTCSLPWHASTRRGNIRIREAAPVIRVPPMSGVPSEVIALCDRCLSNRPDDRPTSRQAADVLRAALVDHDPDQPADVLAELAPPSGRAATAPGPAEQRAGDSVKRPAGRRLLAAGVALAGLALLVHPPWSSVPGTPAQAQQPVLSAAGGDCAVRYVAHRSADAFTAELTLRAPATPDWTLEFLLAPGQRVSDVAGPVWTQHGRRLTLTGTGTRPDRTAAPVVVALTGDLTRPDGVAPTAFDLNGTACRPSVTVFTTEPAIPGAAPSSGVPTGSL